MTLYTPPTGQLAVQFNACFDRANRVSKGLFLFDGAQPTPMGCMARRRARYAIRCYRKCVELHPGSTASYCFMGKVHQALGEHAAALESLENALRIEPDNAIILREASIEASLCHRHDAAIRFAKQSVELTPGQPVPLSNLASIYYSADRLAEAVAAAEEAHRLDPNDQINNNLIAAIKRKQIQAQA